MQRPPLQVDTVTSGWDILSALGDFFGGIFAGGALLIAAIAYKRQVDDNRRAQAAAISLTLTPPVSRSYTRVPGKGLEEPCIDPVVAVSNVGTPPVYRARLGVTWSNKEFEFVDIAQIMPGGAHLTSPLQGEVSDAQLEFVDASGRYWIKTANGILVGERYTRQPQRPFQWLRLRSRRHT